MVEQINYALDVDPDQKWYDWGDLLGRDHLSIPGIVYGLPGAISPEDHVLRVLAVSTWLMNSGFYDAELMVGFDEEGHVAYCPHRQPFLQVSATLENMTTRPALISRGEVSLATTQAELAEAAVAQWLPFSNEIDFGEIMDAHCSRMDYWAGQIHQQEIKWFANDTSRVMGVVVIEAPDEGGAVVFDCMQAVVALPLIQRNKLFSGEFDGYMGAFGKAIVDAYPYVDFGPSHSVTAYFAGPSIARIATLQAREMDEQTPMSPVAPRGPRL